VCNIDLELQEWLTITLGQGGGCSQNVRAGEADSSDQERKLLLWKGLGEENNICSLLAILLRRIKGIRS
jgi:hypothetical protein